MSLYLEHYGLSEAPFRITPHTDFFFNGADRGATLEALLYAVLHDEGIVKVSGEVGSGKTMLCRVLMERLPQHVDTIYLATASLARDEILHAIADDLELKLSSERTMVALRELQEHLIRLYAAGRRVVVLIDEAHVMPDETLEQVRLLSNLETSRHKLLQIVLFGQPELDATLGKAELRQLRDRITQSFRVRPLPAGEVARYISFRMRAAGYRGPEVFAARAVARIARASGGLSRRINILCDKSLLAAYTENTHGVTEQHVRAAIQDSEFAAAVPGKQRPRRLFAYVGAALVAGLTLGVGMHWLLSQDPTPPAAAVSRAATVPRAAAVSPATPPASAPVPVAAPGAQPQPAAQAAAPAPTAPQPQAASASAQAQLVAAQAASPAPPAAAEKKPEPEPALHLDRSQRRRIASYSTAGQKLLGARVAAAREALERTPDEGYVLELFYTDNTDPARMERFLVRARDLVPLEELLVVPVRGPGKHRLRVVLGHYETRAAALEAARRLPPKYQQAFHPLPRTFAELRSQI